MLPPSDSLRHQSHKRSEATANTQREDRRPPPPPYSPPIRLPPSIEDFLHGATDLDEYDEADEADSRAPRITIHIDASITIIGDANTVVIPPSSTSCPTDLPGTSSTSDPTTALQAVQRARQTKLSDMATAIIDALGRRGLLDPDRAGCPAAQASVEVKITPGIRVEGNRNAVCVGALPRALGRRSSAGAGERDGGRKRRACSVCSFSFVGCCVADGLKLM